jgi:hypothetical protein
MVTNKEKLKVDIDKEERSSVLENRNITNKRKNTIIL